MMRIEELDLYEGDRLTDALRRKGYKNIPSNVVLDKTLTGIGATYAELHAERDSIIIEPNVPVIIGKTEDHADWLAVWEGCTPKRVEKYLKSKVRHKKLICTPEGFSKIRNASRAQGIDIYSKYFCLMDECEKFIQDVDFRKRITQPVCDFFQFKEKAMVSATPLPMRHESLSEQDFRKLKVMPRFDYKKGLNLIVTNCYVATMRNKFAELRDSPCVCVFLNSTAGINKVITTLNLTDYKVFCSKKSVDDLKEREFENVYEMLDKPLAKYNFFTCRFFSAVDIDLDIKPDILILTDLMEALYTMIDPFTEAIQIQGRFSNGFNSLTHISNVDWTIPILSDDDITETIDEAWITYSDLKGRFELSDSDIRKRVIAKEMRSVTYAEFLDKQGNINHFAVDNLYNEERVKRYYKDEEYLLNAYKETGFFNVRYSLIKEPLGEDSRLKLKLAKTDIEKRKILVRLINELYENKGILNDIEPYLDMLRKGDQGAYTVDAFQKIGKEGLEKAEYKKSLINKAVKEYDKNVHRFLPEVVKDIQNEFALNEWIDKEETRDRLKKIYERHSIIYTVKLNTIEDYFWTDVTHAKKPYKYLLKKPKQDLGNF